CFLGAFVFLGFVGFVGFRLGLGFELLVLVGLDRLLVEVLQLEVVLVVVLFLGDGPRAAAAQRTAARRTAALRLAAATELELLVGVPVEHDRDVAGAVTDAHTSPTCARTPALHGRTFVGERTGDEQLVLEHVVVVLGVRDRGLEQLRDFT